MKAPLKILLVEDSPDDADLVMIALKRSGLKFHHERVEDALAMREALEAKEWDLILSDYSLPQFDALRALQLRREIKPELPFIIVSGTIGEETAVEALKHGANDYLLKQNLTRLGPSVERALSQARDHRLRREAEQSLRKSESQFRLMAESLPEIIWLYDVIEKRVLYLSAAFEVIFQHTVDEVLDPHNSNAFLEWVHPEDKERFIDNFAKVNQPGEISYRIIRPDNSVRYLRTRRVPVTDADGQTISMVGVTEDYTERKELEEQYLRAQRMESIGTLAGGIAHDLNNTLAPIMLCCGNIRLITKDPKVIEYAKIIESCVGRGTSVLRQVLTFARGAVGNIAPMDISSLIVSVVDILGKTLNRSIRLEKDIEKDIWNLMGDATQIEQVLMNLCLNAADAMPHGGVLTLKAYNVSIDETYAQINVEADVGDYVVLEICDTGTGISPENLKQIFEPFFTTKEVGKGTGLGLATAYAIVKSHKGFIHAYSELGKGTTFKIYLPASSEGVVEQKPIEDGDVPMGQGETILIVDDEKPIVDAVCSLLERYNYQVLRAANGAAAVATYATHKDRISVVVTDMMMPVMDGAATILALQSMKPDVKVIGTSGLLANGGVAKAVNLGVKHFLTKPFTGNQLLALIHQILNE